MLSTTRVQLRAISPRDYEVLRMAELDETVTATWRHRGSTPSPDDYVARLWASVLSQYIVVRRNDNNGVGLVSIHGADFVDGYAHLAAVKFNPSDRSSAFAEGAGLFLNHVFDFFPFRKLYMYTSERAMAAFKSAVGSLFVEEGRLPNHSFFAGSYEDEVILALYRDTWASSSVSIGLRSASTGEQQ